MPQTPWKTNITIGPPWKNVPDPRMACILLRCLRTFWPWSDSLERSSAVHWPD